MRDATSRPSLPGSGRLAIGASAVLVATVLLAGCSGQIDGKTLHPDELAAVLAHERAHVRARHHLVVAAAAGLARAFPKVPLLRDAALAIPSLVEMAADDSASRCTDRNRVATALLALAGTAAPVAALAAGGPGALRRVQRLLRPSAPLNLGATTAALGLAIALLVVPAIAAVAPAWAAGPMINCSMTSYGAPSSTTTG